MPKLTKITITNSHHITGTVENKVDIEVVTKSPIKFNNPNQSTRASARSKSRSSGEIKINMVCTRSGNNTAVAPTDNKPKIHDV
jgi:hypothetical protein